VPVLPPTSTPLIWAPVPVPSFTAATIICRSWLAVRGETAWLPKPPSDQVSMSGPRIWRPLGSRTASTRRGAISSPSLTRAAASSAICIGVARTSRCPMALWAVEGTSMDFGTALVATPSS
jgi:hypothetical protein